MSQRVLVNLGQGNWSQGFPGVTAQLWDSHGSRPMQFSGSLPPNPQLGTHYEQWRSLYGLLYGDRPTRNPLNTEAAHGNGATFRDPNNTDDNRLDDFDVEFDVEIDEDDLTNISATEFNQLGQQLGQQLNQWLEASSFRPIDSKLRTHLTPDAEIRLIISAQDKGVLRFPWRLWNFFEDYPRAELALSALTYRRSVKDSRQKPHSTVNVLAILGNANGIDVDTDQTVLSNLPDSTVTILAEPSLDDVNQALWTHPWDILFFAGHSSTRGQVNQQTGYLQLNTRDRMSLSQLKYGLKTAIANGLQLAIFNSCDGLGLAWDLAELSIPQVIVMREPVPDQVAHTFMKQFLKDFSEHQSLYLSVRNAREQLQPLELQCPCATWLPIIVQNPAEPPGTWQDFLGHPASSSALTAASPLAPAKPKEPDLPQSPAPQPSPPAPIPAPIDPPSPVRSMPWITALTPLFCTLLVLGLRFMGSLEFMELLSLDRLMRLRPAEEADRRLLIVTIDEADMQAQAVRGSSLSDAALEKALTILKKHNARVVGLDIYRDYPVSEEYPQLQAMLKATPSSDSTPLAIVGVCKGLDPIADVGGVSPPPELTEDFVGFSDFIEDPDGIVRRQLLSMRADPAAACTTPYAFSTRLAFLYLYAENIEPSFNDDDHLVLGETVLPQLSARNGGYQPIDARGGQILLNYRALPSPAEIAETVSLSKLIDGEVNPEAIANRVVLIGVTANSATDHWATPYGASGSGKTSGVFIQAQMTSQLLSAVLDQRPLLRPTSTGVDILWTAGWAIAGSAIAIFFQGRRNAGDQKRSEALLWILGSSTLGIVCLGGSCLWLLVQGYWLPLIPAALAFIGSSGGITLMMNAHHDESLDSRSDRKQRTLL